MNRNKRTKIQKKKSHIQEKNGNLKERKRRNKKNINIKKKGTNNYLKIPKNESLFFYFFRRRTLRLCPKKETTFQSVYKTDCYMSEIEKE